MSGDEGFGPPLRGGPRSGPVVRPRGRGGARSVSRQDRPPPPPPPDDDFGPPMRGRATGRGRGAPPPGRSAPPRQRPRRRRRGGAGRVLLIVLLILLMLVVGAPLALAAYASAQIDRVPVEGLGSAPGLQMNVLVVGSDSREGLTDEEVRELGTGRVAGRRADTLMILSIRGTRAAMLSLPRDLYVTRCDGSGGRINAAFNIGDGRSCLVETVTAATGIGITHYVELDFLSFVRLVDAVGTVEVCTDRPIRDAAAAIDLPEGCSDLTGAQALGFVRVRGIDDDFGRQGRQQYFIQQLANEIASPSTLTSPTRLFRTAGAAGDTLIADERFGTFDLMRLGLGARGLGSAPSYTVPVTPRTIGGAAVLEQIDAEAQPLYAAFRDGTVFTDPPPAAE